MARGKRAREEEQATEPTQSRSRKTSSRNSSSTASSAAAAAAAAAADKRRGRAGSFVSQKAAQVLDTPNDECAEPQVLDALHQEDDNSSNPRNHSGVTKKSETEKKFEYDQLTCIACNCQTIC